MTPCCNLDPPYKPAAWWAFFCPSFNNSPRRIIDATLTK
jgi:hypothetical protein